VKFFQFDLLLTKGGHDFSHLLILAQTCLFKNGLNRLKNHLTQLAGVKLAEELSRSTEAPLQKVLAQHCLLTTLLSTQPDNMQVFFPSSFDEK
jgi:hypothetical protein